MKDGTKAVIVLELLAYTGLVLPLIFTLAGFPFLGYLLFGIWWFLPGCPIPTIHLFIGGYMPFVIGYPMSLMIACEEIFEDPNKAPTGNPV